MGAKQILLSIGVVFIAIISSNIRWRYVCKNTSGRVLPYTLVEGGINGSIPVVLLHGMWHSPREFQPLQSLLQRNGVSSYAISLLPGERALYGGTQTELIRDLEKTFETLPNLKENGFILLGHSQGGLLVQSIMKYSPVLNDMVRGVVLLGTYPLGLLPPLQLMKQKKNMYQFIPYSYLSLTGKLFSIEYTKHIFLIDETDYKTDTTMQSYLQRLMDAPADGFITVSHFLTSTNIGIITEKATLVLGAKYDIIYPPDLLATEFKKRFPNSIQIVSANQAHCFVDVGWEESMGRPLIEWIKKLG